MSSGPPLAQPYTLPPSPTPDIDEESSAEEDALPPHHFGAAPLAPSSPTPAEQHAVAAAESDDEEPIHRPRTGMLSTSEPGFFFSCVADKAGGQSAVSSFLDARSWCPNSHFQKKKLRVSGRFPGTTRLPPPTGSFSGWGRNRILLQPRLLTSASQ